MAEKGKPVPEWICASLVGTALEECNVRHAFTRMLEKAELRRIRSHAATHVASLLLQQGESASTSKEQLGHGSIQITVDPYGHLIPVRIAQQSIASTTTCQCNQSNPGATTTIRR